MPESLLLFTDASVAPQHQIAVGGFLCLTRDDFLSQDLDGLLASIPDKIVYREFPTHKSSYAEILTVIEALDYVKALQKSLRLFTDCQTVCHLLGERRAKLENVHFTTGAGKELAHAELYRELFGRADRFELTWVKLEGHKASKAHKTREDLIFQILDKSVRKKLRFAVQSGLA